jgi:hypothetical protein
MKYLFFIDKPFTGDILGKQITEMTRLLCIVLMVIQSLFLLSYLVVGVGEGTYILSLIKYASIWTLFWTTFNRQENLAYLAYIVYQIFIWLQLTVIGLLISMEALLFHHASQSYVKVFNFYIILLSLQLGVELASGYLIFSYIKSTTVDNETSVPIKSAKHIQLEEF